jgi:branched-chain amino acid transport system permease protein
VFFQLPTERKEFMLWVVVQSLINGLFNGGIYALVAVGITIIFGVMKIVNFAQGEFMMLGMYMALVFFNLTGLNTYLLIPFVIVAMAAIAYISYRLTIKPLLGKDETTFIIVTLGLGFLFQSIIQLIFGPGSLTVPSDITMKSLKIGTFTISLPRFIAFCSGLILVFLVNMLLNKTRIGRAMRATAENSGVANILGVPTKRIYTFSFIISIVVAGIAGLLITPMYYFMPTVGNPYKIIAFVVVVLGGLGSIKGALIGGLMLGVIEALVSTLIAPELGPAGIFVLFIIMLYFRPQGIFGLKERKG